MQEWQRGEQVSHISVDGAATDEDLPAKVRDQARELLESVELVESDPWVRSVYGYMRNMWTPAGVWVRADELSAGRPEGAPAEWHAAVQLIRQYFPKHQARVDLIAVPGKGYGSWPCVKCGERVQYQAQFDALCVVTSKPAWKYEPVCAKGGQHEIEQTSITVASVLREAGALLSVDGENPEYDRAVVELTASLLGHPHDKRDEVSRLIRDQLVAGKQL